ncbi:hypothetical protein L0B53_00100 [Vibrio sp. SS-MA-C1-2]|uniref:hypothetical protein n=1 Tax=Vibrio sp. SS-MA-C1-2 TaxID=2908646 RepID=UPI001F3B83F9|nr:hypothetical protein [Vibrio sp. SS-MA-C1-2]UJF17213.1 hypothetical protein L0B53_00100 [Vibrio sp. SS-MA-C1-2]
MKNKKALGYSLVISLIIVAIITGLFFFFGLITFRPLMALVVEFIVIVISFILIAWLSYSLFTRKRVDKASEEYKQVQLFQRVMESYFALLWDRNRELQKNPYQTPFIFTFQLITNMTISCFVKWILN